MLIESLGIVSRIREKDPFISEKAAEEIATEILEDMEKKVGHNKELIRKELLKKKHGVEELDRLIVEYIRKRKLKKRMKKPIKKKKKQTGENKEIVVAVEQQ